MSDTAMSRAFAGAKSASDQVVAKRVPANLAAQPLKVRLGSAFDPNEFIKGMTAAVAVQDRQKAELQGMSDRSKQFDGLLAQVPLFMWTACRKQEDPRAEIRRKLHEARENRNNVMVDQLQNMLDKLDAELMPLFNGEVGELTQGEKDQAGTVARIAWTIYQLSIMGDNPSKRTLEWLLARLGPKRENDSAFGLYIVSEIGTEAAQPRNSAVILNGRTRYAYSAHGAESIVAASLRDFFKENEATAKALGIPAEPPRVVVKLNEAFAIMNAARRMHIREGNRKLYDGAKGTVVDLKKGTAGDFVLYCPEEESEGRKYDAVKVRIHSDGKTVNFVGAFGRAGAIIERFIGEGVTLPVSSLFETRPSADLGLKGMYFGAWATLRRGILNEAKNLAEELESEKGLQDEILACEEYARSKGMVLVSEDDWNNGAIGPAVKVYRGKFRFRLRGKHGAEPELKSEQNVSAVVERWEDGGVRKVTVHFAPDRVGSVFSQEGNDAMGIAWNEIDQNREGSYSGVQHSTLRGFLRATGKTAVNDGANANAEGEAAAA